MNNRYRDALAGKSLDQGGTVAQAAEEVDCIPSSAPRRGQMDPPPSSRIACTPFTDKIAATPARASAVPGRLLQPPARDDVILGSSPLGTKRTGPSAKTLDSLATVAGDFLPGSSPILPRKVAAVAQSTSPRGSTVSRTLFQTPLKARAVADAEPAQPRPTTSTQAAGNPLSIYQQLGWDEMDDDDDDDDDL